jgi:hypothetical protein
LCAKAQPGFQPAADPRLKPAAKSEPGFQSCAEPRLEAAAEPAAETAARLQADAFIAREPELIGHRLLQTGNRIAIAETQPGHSGGGR